MILALVGGQKQLAPAGLERSGWKQGIAAAFDMELVR